MQYGHGDRQRGCGPLLRRWRELRHLSQLDLALDAGISTRHLSYIETGKTLPSREMLLVLAQTLDVPLRERNLLFLAAGYAPLYAETPLDDARMAEARAALQLILRQHEPYSAFACDRYWNLVMANAAYVEFLQYTVGARAAALSPHVALTAPRLNVLHLIFEDGPLRQVIVNWQEVAKALLEQLQRAALWTHDPLMHDLIAELLAYPGVPQAWREPQLDATRRLLLPCELTGLGAAHNARMFSTMTTLSGPRTSPCRTCTSRPSIRPMPRPRRCASISAERLYSSGRAVERAARFASALCVSTQGAQPCVYRTSLARDRLPPPWRSAPWPWPQKTRPTA